MKYGFAIAALTGVALAGEKKIKLPPPSPVDIYVKDAYQHARTNPPGTSGSLWSPGATFEKLGTDLRATRVDDILTIVVSESTSAVATGNVKTARNSNVNSTIAAAGGLTKKTGPLTNLLNANTQTALDGSGTTSRGATLTTTMTARVVDVLPNGFLVVEGDKNVEVNSENQTIIVRGIVRPVDILAGNTIPAASIAQLEVRVNGKGVVNDAVHRPNFLYRLILGVLPF